ncbi:TRAP-type C4-dicarboxylate transport system, small permease component [Lachnospiraceae bacterium]|nr:TRAP-type C4-dicarboxylate transport system, small permease component [Lachnospiraceae bacterium]
MKKVLKYLEENLEEMLMVLMLGAMAVIMGVQVFSRYVLGVSLSWSEEITRYLFIWSAFMSVSLCTRKCISIKIDQFIKFFPERGEAAFKIVNLTFSFIYFAYLIPYSAAYLKTTIASGQVSPACGIPMYYIQAAPLVCFSLTGIRLIQRWIINLEIILKKKHPDLGEGSLAGSITESVTDNIGNKEDI